MSIKDEVERLFRESIDNHPDQDFIESLGELEFKYFKDPSSIFVERAEGVRVFLHEQEFLIERGICSKAFVEDTSLGKLRRSSLAELSIREIKRIIDQKNRQQVQDLLKQQIKSLPDQNLIKTYGMYNDKGTETFLAEVPNHERGLFYAGGSYPVFWGKEMNTIKFIKSQEYRKTFVNDVILTIMEHCEVNGIC